MPNVASSGGEKLLIQMVNRHLMIWAPRPINLGMSGRKTVQPDIVFDDERIAVFYDGCYWHGCPRHAPDRVQTLAKDRRITARLIELGWQVIRVWEHEELEPHVTLIVQSVKAARVHLAKERAAHMAQHDTNAWCEDCEVWPHRPWPIGKHGACLRCGCDADEHESADHSA